MPKTTSLSLTDEQRIYNLRNKKSAITISKDYKISTSRVYDIWKQYDNVIITQSRSSDAIMMNNIAHKQIVIDKQKSDITKLKDEISKYQSQLKEFDKIIDDQKYEIKPCKTSS
ncbi:hypothetical protein CHS0354_038058, partial [Potamilus streckersoni]